jgi:cell division protein FtsQ
VTPANRRVSPSPPLPATDVNGFSLGPSPDATGSPRARFVSHVRKALGAAIVVGAWLVVAWLARRHVTTSPRFALTSIDVVGNERRSSDAIVAESGLALGANVFGADLDSARARILGDPWLVTATLTRHLPGTIVIQVAERVPVALAAIGDIFLADASGEPFKKLELGDAVDLPLITGVTPESVAEDRDAALRDIRRGIDLAAEYERSGLAKRATLQEVHHDPGGAFTLVVGRPSMDIVLGGPPFRRKLEQAARVVAELDKRRAKADSIMLDNEARPERVVVRLR